MKDDQAPANQPVTARPRGMVVQKNEGKELCEAQVEEGCWFWSRSSPSWRCMMAARTPNLDRLAAERMRFTDYSKR